MARSSPLNDPLPSPKLASALQRNRVTASELATRGREGMWPRARLKRSPCRRALLVARSFSRGLVPVGEHSFVNVRASGAIEVPLESSAASVICPLPSSLLAVLRRPPAWRDFKIGPLEPYTLFENRRVFYYWGSSDGHAMARNF